MSVQMLSPQYIQALKKNVISNDDWGRYSQLDQLVNSGEIQKSGDNYFVVGKKNIEKYSKFIEKTDKTYMIGPKGTIVERQEREVPADAKTKTSINYTMGALVEKMGIDDKAVVDKLKAHLAGQEGITISENGEIVCDDIVKLNEALKTFAEANQESFVVKQNTATFTEDSDSNIVAKLQEGDAPAIAEDANPNDNVYNIKNEAALDAALPEVVETKYEDASKVEKVEVTANTVSTYEEDLIGDIPANLRSDKDARKGLEKRAKDAYAELLAGGDPALRFAADIYVAERKYGKQVAKKEKELLEGQLSTGKKYTRSDVEIIDMYLDNYVGKEDKAKINMQINAIRNALNKGLGDDAKPEEIEGLAADKQAVLEAHNNRQNIKGNENFVKRNSYEEMTEAEKQEAILFDIVQKRLGLSPADMLKLMAISEVMSARDSKQVAEDDVYFIKEQSKDFVKNQQAEQDVAAGNKGLDKLNKEGQRLVKTCAQTFADEVTAQEFTSNKNNKDYFEAKIKNEETGQFETKYFKFNFKTYQKIMGIACDPEHATEEDKTYLRSMNMTLQEGREGIENLIRTNDGVSVPIVNIIGNNNGKVDNKELNAWRHMVEAAGYSVDGNSTYWKRLGHFAKNVGIGGGLGLATGGLGALWGGVVNFAGQTASQFISYSGVTADRTITGTGTAQVTTTDYYTDKYGTTSVTHITDVEVPYSRLVEGQEYSGQVEAKGQDYSGHTDNRLGQTVRAGILGAVGGAVNGLRTMGGVQERGRDTDDVFSLKRTVVKEGDPQPKTVDLQVPQYVKAETRENTVEEQAGYKACKLKVTRHPSKRNHNQGETMESMVAKYYGVEIGSAEYKELFNKVKEFNQVDRFGGFQYTADKTFYLPDFIILSDGTRKDRTANPEENPLALDKQDIPLGGRGSSHKASASQTGSKKHVKCTKR